MNIKKLVVPSIAGLSVVAGIAAGSAINALSAAAESDTTSSGTATTTSSTSKNDTTPPAQRDESKSGHQANGKTEALLTGDTAIKAKAAAEAAVSGGTVLRVETDAEGSTYEAHVKKSDGTQVTVKMDASFKVTSIEDGPR